MRFAVIGAGNTGQAFAAYLALRGEEVTLYDRNREKVRTLTEKGIELRNKLNGKAAVKVTTEMKDAVAGAEFIFVTTTAAGHKNVCEHMKPFLEDKQTIVITPGYWGAIEFQSILQDTLDCKKIVIAETDAMMLVCKSPEAGIVDVKSIKSKVSLGALPSDQARHTVERLKRLFPQWEPAASVWETSINNTNVIVHPPIMVFNASRVDFGETFRFYYEGASPLTAAYIEKIDRERLQIAKALGVRGIPVLDLLVSFYGGDFDTLHDSLRTTFVNSVAPTSFEHRYLTEDIPYGLVPISELGLKLGIPTPYTDRLIDIASLYLNIDFRNKTVFQSMREWSVEI